MGKPKKGLDADALLSLLRTARVAQEEGRVVVSIPTEDLIDLVHIAQASMRGPGLLPRRRVRA